MPNVLTTDILLLASLAVFIFTPTAEAFARSRYFVPLLFTMLGAYAVASVITAFRDGRISPLIRGAPENVDHESKPRMFWVSTIWNGALGLAITFVAWWTFMDWNDRHCERITSATDVDQTIEACTNVIDRAESVEEEVEALIWRGNAHGVGGRLDVATEDFRRAVRLDPGDITARYALGLVLMDTGEFAAAITQFDAILEIDPDDHWANANRGMCHAWLGQNEAAMAEFATVRAVDEDNPVMLRGEALMAFDANDFELALEKLDEAIELDPEDTWSLNTRSEVYWAMGREADSRRDQRRLEELRELPAE